MLCKDDCVIWGTGNDAKSAFWMLKRIYNILFFVDSDSSKQGKTFFGKTIYSPEQLRQCKGKKLFIGSSQYYQEIKKQAMSYGIENAEYAGEHGLEVEVQELLHMLNSKRSINIGELLKREQVKNGGVTLKSLTFVAGGSGVLDYALLYLLAKKYNLKKYLEIGTYIGESINILTDVCDTLYSVTAPPDADFSMDATCRVWNIPNYTDRLSQASNVIHFYDDSHTFDFSKVERDIDLYFIDAEHSYDAVYTDTKNVFAHKKASSFVVWHDIKGGMDQERGLTVAIKDAIGEEFDNFYIVDNNFCGIYIPSKYQKDFPLHEWKYCKNDILYTYNTKLVVDTV